MLFNVARFVFSERSNYLQERLISGKSNKLIHNGLKKIGLHYFKLIIIAITLILAVNSLIAYPGNHVFSPKDERVQETVVYITNTGTKYHKSTCRYLSQSKIKTTLKKAKAAGNDACKVCKP